MKKPVLAYCISGHGFGHGVRSTALYPYIKEYFDIHIITSLPKSFFEEEGMGACIFHSLDFDAGCTQLDTLRVDISATLKRAQNLAKMRTQLIDLLQQIFRDCMVSVVLSDAGALPLAAAAEMNLPRFLMANFTWVEIYNPYIDEHSGFAEIVAQMAADYKCANSYLYLSPGMHPEFDVADITSVGMLARTGNNRKIELGKILGINPNKKWCLIYIGNYGLDGMDYARLSGMQDWQFLGVYPLAGASDNYCQLQKSSDIAYADLTASCDVVLGKLGYGLVCECMALATPILYFERYDFSEHAMLERAVRYTDLGVKISIDDLRELNWKDGLEKAYTLKPFEQRAEAAKVIASKLMSV